MQWLSGAQDHEHPANRLSFRAMSIPGIMQNFSDRSSFPEILGWVLPVDRGQARSGYSSTGKNSRALEPSWFSSGNP